MKKVEKKYGNILSDQNIDTIKYVSLAQRVMRGGS